MKHDGVISHVTKPEKPQMFKLGNLIVAIVFIKFLKLKLWD